MSDDGADSVIHDPPQPTLTSAPPPQQLASYDFSNLPPPPSNYSGAPPPAPDFSNLPPPPTDVYAMTIPPPWQPSSQYSSLPPLSGMLLPPPQTSSLSVPMPPPPPTDILTRTTPNVSVHASSLLGYWAAGEDMDNVDHIKLANKRYWLVDKYGELPQAVKVYGLHTRGYEMDITRLSKILSISKSGSGLITSDSLRNLTTLSTAQHGESIERVTTAFSIVLKHIKNLNSADTTLADMYCLSEDVIDSNRVADLRDLVDLLHRGSHKLNRPGLKVMPNSACTCLLFHDR